MENGLTSFNVIHWECNLDQLKKPTRFNILIGVSGGWLNETAILHFKWRVMCYVENATALHLVAENNYAITDLALFNKFKMKELVLRSYEKVFHEIGLRTSEIGEIFGIAEVYDLPETMVSMYYKEFLKALL